MGQQPIRDLKLGESPCPAASDPPGQRETVHSGRLELVTASISNSELAAASVPSPFGRYKIVRKLGEGGMGTVYLAYDEQLDRQVALKVPHISATTEGEILDRFYREARAAATIDHPNLCPVHDVGEINGTPYLTMAFIEGRPLSDIISAHPAAKPLPERHVALLVRKLALALHAAHLKGVLHRDLKPANIMLDQRHEPVIMDFGLARRTQADDVRITKSGALLGSPAYMSPEQVLGSIHEIGPGSDIYSLGVILYELLTGQLPFQGTLTAVLTKIVNDAPLPLTSHRADIDPALAAICAKAMAKRIENRYPSMADMAKSLTAYLKPRSRHLMAGTALRSKALWTLLIGGIAVLLVAVLPKPPTPVGTPAMTFQPAETQSPTRVGTGNNPAKASEGDSASQTAVSSATAPDSPEAHVPPTLERSTEVDSPELPPVRVAVPAREAPGLPGTTLTNSIGMKLTLIPAGEFQMGSDNSDQDAEGDERPRHRVVITQAFYLGTYEVTTGQFREFVQATGYKTDAEANGKGSFGYTGDDNIPFGQRHDINWRNPGYEQSDDHPVVHVDWHDTQAFIKWLNGKEDVAGYRLPSEAEWEYACRAGTSARFQGGDDDETLAHYGNVADRTAKQKFRHLTTISSRDGYVFTAPVGRFQPNAYGLYDMHGNVWEWCDDWYDARFYANSPVDDPQGPAEGLARVFRGGSWLSSAKDCRSAFRDRRVPSWRFNEKGFRVALDPPADK